MLKLYEYQQEIVDRERDKDSHALFVGMGLGKTVMSLELMKLKPTNKLLVVCLVSKVNDWVSDAKSQSGLTLVPLRKGTKKNIELLNSDCDGFVVNFESLWRLGDSLLDMIDDTWSIIVDESHNIKTPTSKVTRYTMRLGKRTPYKCILTGTPQSGGYVDYLTQMNFLGKWNMTRKEFEDQYCVMVEVHWTPYKSFEIGSYKNTNKLNELLAGDCVYLERDSKYPTTHIDVEIDNSPPYRRWMKDKVFKWKENGTEHIHIGDSSGGYRSGLRTFASGHLGLYRRESEKLTWLRDLFNSYDKRVVVFYNFNKERDDIISLCESLELPWSEYNGRGKDLTKFMTEDNGVAICNYKSASVGINDLVVAQVCVFYSPTDDYILFEQAKKRIDRIGQTGSPTLYYLRVKGTVEVAIYNALQKGLDFDDRLFDIYLDMC